MQGGIDVLAPATKIHDDIVVPLEALASKPDVTEFKFAFGTHTGYQVGCSALHVFLCRVR